MTAPTELYTKVKNVSGATKMFGFLGPHGMSLVDDEVVILPGNLITKLGNQRSQRSLEALASALDDGDLVIIKTPDPVLEDTSLGCQTLVSADTTVDADAPTWGAATAS